jgi:hypothetical protein
MLPARERQLMELILRCGHTEALETGIQTVRLQPLRSLPLPVIPISFAVADAAGETLVEQLSLELTIATQGTSPRSRKSAGKRHRAPQTPHAETSHVEPEE